MSISYDRRRSVLVDRVPQRAGIRQLLQPRQPLREAFAHHVLEVVVERIRRRHVEVGQEILALRAGVTSHRSAIRTVFAQRVRESP